MGRTIAEKILSEHCQREVRAGEIVVCDLDFLMAQDGTAPLAISSFEKMGVQRVFDPQKMALVIDHNSPSPLESVSNLHALMRNFAADQGVFLYDVGEGICHQLVPERGHITCGDLVIGADSHTCTYGALNLFSTGVGSTDLAAAMMTGKLWFKVPESIRIILRGKLPPGVYAKDLILHLIGKFTADGATYRAVEFSGQLVADLSMEARFTIANMVVEMGAKAGIFEADERALQWVTERCPRTPRVIAPDPDAYYLQTMELDVTQLSPQVAKPHQVDRVVAVDEVAGVRIDQAVLGTCTNGRLEDLEVAAAILKGRKVYPEVRFIVVPASRYVLLEAISKGIVEILIKAGAVLVAPGCGPCVGTHAGIPSDGENVISTANRNFRGRMGNSKANIYLASPATVAASALAGKIADPREYLER
ncbi:3-isopropylmalate/(R)-2-methylmalate dehydratase large subunit [Candidatus Hakubella thermalkaliphila]|uniref:3-isopropylmalate dehydratase large subunit n=1 Tax=Candidatus Hakubella thermalkaliphila TaxID=2754717 RepID=A0A6V8NLP3_9ACTN|nr:3-isopropylmalate dehydratase large subunit [Candidatus Hakubella thermalkaliphila]GFP21212.1 3-isopropylmalate/(R)-2-methylmalate dehydratase large subunit [Candidatus Hakubella thermalkaliphila]